MAKKTIKKYSIPAITVDLTEVESIADVYAAVAVAVLEKYCTYSEIASLTDRLASHFYVHYCPCESCPCCENKKKPNIFKRIWNWITRKK